MSETLTRRLATLIADTRPDETARGKSRAGVLDYLAVTLPVLLGRVADSGMVCLRRVYDGRDARTRALLLGYAGHALDYDDFHPDFRGHPSTVILPALFALAAEHPTVGAARFLDAYTVGVEAAGRLGLAAGRRHYAMGFHSTGTLGTLAATAAAARLVKADAGATAVMLGIAATQASGLRAQTGSAAKPLHAGLAAQAAVAACQLALAGFSGQPDGIIEDFLAASCGGQQDPDLLTDRWGEPWRIVTPGLEFKPYAACSGTHSAADAARRLRRQWLDSGHTLDALLDRLDHIEVAFPPGGDLAPSVRRPRNGMEARFSLEYVIAAGLLLDDLTLAEFAEGPVNPAISALAQRVSRCPDPLAPPDELDPSARFHQVTLFFHHDAPLRCKVTRRESLSHPVDLSHKLRRCLAGETDATIDAIESLSRLDSPSALSRLGTLLLSALHQPRR
ncbi:MmgE/PrpD family protein [Sodalis sp. RH14]|uniref:MmgE/PrpD family protein n=1 Tax=Sodalis sp. RH14 TaxID=3394329 RepID=UPI0039B66187